MRKNQAIKRQVLPDPIYHSKLVTRAINTIMKKGKKSLAQNIFYNSFKIIKDKTHLEPLAVFNKALENVMPKLELRVRRLAGANYQVPTEVSTDRRIALGLRWIVMYARLRHEKTMVEKLANELIDASNNVGASVKKRDDTHKMAESNKAFAHLRW